MPAIWYSVANVLLAPEARGIATQLNPFWSEPDIASWSVFQRFAWAGSDVKLQVGALPGPLSVQLHALPSVSGVLPSTMRSMDPELSMRSKTFGSGGLVSTCCACAAPDAKSTAIPEAAASARAFPEETQSEP